jgi:hypothetical protein
MRIVPKIKSGTVVQKKKSARNQIVTPRSYSGLGQLRNSSLHRGIARIKPPIAINTDPTTINSDEFFKGLPFHLGCPGGSVMWD